MFSISNGDEFEEFADELEALQDDITEAIDAGVELTAVQVEGSAKENAPVDTGALRASIRFEQISTARYIVGSSIDYADDVEFGTSPHVITPDEAEALRFPGEDGEPVFAMRVEHPGTPAQPFLRPALKEHESELVTNIESTIQTVVSRF